MMQLSPSDLNFVLSRCPKDVRKLLTDNPGSLFLAGGFIRATIAGEKVSDIDLFGKSADDLLRIAKDLTLDRKGRYFKTDNAITVLAPPRIPVQFITRWLFNDPAACIASFDYTVCQAVIWAEKVEVNSIETDENGVNKKTSRILFHSAISDHFYQDLAARRLVYTFPKRDEEAGGSFMRMVKFIKKGYNIQAPSMGGIIARIAMNVDQKAWSDERWMAQVISGLLRQVDPLLIVDGIDFIDEHEVIEGAQ
jgi:hypothetical protein